MTVINPNSVAGINSITVQSGNSLAVHKANGELIRTLTSSSGVSTFSTLSVGTATTDNSAAKSINIGLGASISQHTDNTLTFGTAGDPVAKFDASGQLILGTGTARQKLHINASDSGAANVVFTNTTTGTDAADGFIVGITGGEDAQLNMQGSANIKFSTADSLRMTLDSSGRLLIGTTTEGHSNADDLTVATSGNTGITIRSGTSNGGNIFFSDATSGTGESAGMISYDHGENIMTFHTNEGNERVRITSGGQVGIASATPTSGFTLDVGGDLTIGEPKGTGNTFLDQKEDGDLHLINSGRTANGASGSPGTAGVGINRFNTRDGGTSLFRDFCVYNGKDTKVLVVDGSASAVGIGTDTPDGALTIAHSGSSTDFLMFNKPGSVGTFARMGHNTSSGTNMLDVRSEGHIRFLTGGNNERLRLQSSGTTIDQFISQNGGININVTAGSDCAAQIRGKADRSATGNTLLSLHGDWDGTAVSMIDFQAGDDTTNKDDGTIDFYTTPSGGSMTHRMRIDHNGDIIMGNTGAFNSNSDINPCFAIGSSAHDRPGIVIRGSSTNKGDISFCDNSGSDSSDGVSEGLLRYDHDGDNMIFHTSDIERMRITHTSGTGQASSSVRIGTTSAIHHTDDCLNVFGGGDSGVAFVAKSSGNGAAIMAYSNYNVAKNFTGQNQSGSTTFSVTGAGALSKSSGSFRIDHPLVGMSTSHYLQHSFIEGPQADLIYRGVVTLSSGVASINIDTVSGMTEGTFVKLCTDVSCFTSNESDWTPVKGSVSGNVLTITAQDNTSTATVSWLVIGERQDDHMKDGNTTWTNSDGKVIVEILKTDVDGGG